MYKQTENAVFNLIMNDSFMYSVSGDFAFGFLMAESLHWDDINFCEFIRDTGHAWAKADKSGDLCPKLREDEL